MTYSRDKRNMRVCTSVLLSIVATFWNPAPSESNKQYTPHTPAYLHWETNARRHIPVFLKSLAFQARTNSKSLEKCIEEIWLFRNKKQAMFSIVGEGDLVALNQVNHETPNWIGNFKVKLQSSLLAPCVSEDEITKEKASRKPLEPNLAGDSTVKRERSSIAQSDRVGP